MTLIYFNGWTDINSKMIFKTPGFMLLYVSLCFSLSVLQIAKDKFSKIFHWGNKRISEICRSIFRIEVVT